MGQVVGKCKEITLKGFVRKFCATANGERGKKYCFVIGAGASRTSGIKSGKELVDIWDKELSILNPKAHENWIQDMDISEDNKYDFYSHFYEKMYEDDPERGRGYLENLMEKALPSIGYIMLSQILSKTDNKVVVTTNFDHLIEDAMVYYDQGMPLVIGHEKLASFATKQVVRPTILKIHRDLLLDPRNKTSEISELEEGFKQALDEIFKSYHPIFIGYAGNDGSLMDYLIRKIEGDDCKAIKEPYWMLYKDDKIDGKINEYLSKTSGTIIPHSGFDSVILEIAKQLGLEIPSEEAMIETAKTRFKQIEEALTKIMPLNSQMGEDGVVKESPDSDKDVDSAISIVVRNSKQMAAYTQFVQSYNKRNYNKALELAKNLVKDEPDNARYHNSLGVTLHALKRYGEALKEKQRAVEIQPDNASYHDSLGVTLNELERHEEALAEVQRAIEIEPDNASYYYSLGATLHELERYDEALKAKQKAIEIEQDNANFYNSMGVTLHALERYDEALKAKQTAVELEPDNARYHNSLSMTLHALKLYDEALMATQKAIEIDPDNASYHYGLGVTLHALKRYGEALQEFHNAIALDPGKSSFYFGLHKVYSALKRMEEADAAYKKAIELKSMGK